jgi:hypothetical protein
VDVEDVVLEELLVLVEQKLVFDCVSGLLVAMTLRKSV